MFHVRKIAVYCGLLLAWALVSRLHDGAAPAAAVIATLWLTPLALAGVGIPLLLAWLYSSTTVYTITSARLVMRYGVALPLAVNIPFKRVTGASLKRHKDGTGDLPLTLGEHDRLGYLHLWPNVRPWRLARAEPMLRAVAAPEQVAEILIQALSGAAARPASSQPAAAPRRLATAAA